MSKWWTYRPEDFLMFSEQVYWHLFEVHNELFWPAHIVTMLAGLGVLILLGKPLAFQRYKPGLLVALMLAASWLLVAFGFLGHSYASINWAAEGMVPVFAIQGLLILIVRNHLANGLPTGLCGALGFGLLAYALVGHPLIAPMDGRPMSATEVFGVAPDPTVIGTLGVILIARSSLNRRLPVLSLALVIPLFWSALSWITLDTMNTWESWVPAAAFIITLVGWSLPDRKPRAETERT